MLFSTGCTQLQLPAIDPSGNSLFLPCPNTTSLSLPCCDDTESQCGILPKPAFVDPPPPPPCLADAGMQPPAPQVIPQQCQDGCCSGPEAVMYDSLVDLKNLTHLPDRGKRGRILLNHRKIIAPVGGEVVLLSGVCGCDGYLMTGEPIEWMLTPDSVGHIIEVGDDKQGMLHRMVARSKVKKLSGSYATGRTSTKAALITRGNHTRGDDVEVRKGETWMTISSPSEGISRVTVMAPESDCWDQRKATATIYWVDANWQFPSLSPLAAGQQGQLITRVTRREGLPAVGWKVRYEVLNPEIAGFDDGTQNLAPIVESVVNENGEAPALIRPRNQQSPGTAVVSVSIVRPAGLDESMPRMTLGSGQTLVTWSAPQLGLRAGAPPFVAQGEPFPIAINVSNSGDRTAENVQIGARLPVGVEFVGTTLVQSNGQRVPAQHTQIGDAIVWEIGNMPAQQQLDIELNVRAKASFQMAIDVRDASGGHASDTVNVTTVNRNLRVQVAPVSNDALEVNQEAEFNIVVTNIGDQPIHDVSIQATGDQGLISFAQDTGEWRSTVYNELSGPLAPRAEERMTVKYQVREPGQRCIQVTATGFSVQAHPQGVAPDQRHVATACIQGANPPPPVPTVSARIDTGNRPVRQGEVVEVNYFVTNTGRVPLTNVEITVTYDDALDPTDLSEHYQLSRELFRVTWQVPRLDPGQTHLVAGRFRVNGGPGAARFDLIVSSAERASTSTEASLEILQAQPTAPSTTIPNAPPPIGVPNPRASQPGPGPATSPNNPAPSTGALRIQLRARNNPVVVGETITYDLIVVNERNVPDADVNVMFYLPAGARLEGVAQTLFNGNVVESISDGIVRLQPVHQLRGLPDEIRYTIRITSNQPQPAMTVRAEARSRLQPGGVADETRVNVLPR